MEKYPISIEKYLGVAYAKLEFKEKFKGYPSLDFHLLYYKKNQNYYIRCLELDLLTEGKDIHSTEKNHLNDIVLEITNHINNNSIDNIYDYSLGNDYYRLYNHIKRKVNIENLKNLRAAKIKNSKKIIIKAPTEKLSYDFETILIEKISEWMFDNVA